MLCKYLTELKFNEGQVHPFNPSTQETEAGGSLRVKPAWSIQIKLTTRATQRRSILKSKNKTTHSTPKKGRKKLISIGY